MIINKIEEYKKLLKLDEDSEFIKIDHEDAMVSTVYKILQKSKSTLILKICDHLHMYSNELYFLNLLAEKIPVPTTMDFIAPSTDLKGGILMEYLQGDLLKINVLTKELAFEIGKSLAIIHENKTDGFGYLNRDLDLTSHPRIHFEEKFEMGVDECKNHLPVHLLTQTCRYFKEFSHLLEHVDGPCLIHRDFRPGNIIIKNNKLSGIIDWSSARASFAEDDFCSIEHGEWGDFNGFKNYFLEGYSSIRVVPDYHQVMPLLRLNRALAVIGFTVKRGTWNTMNTKPYKFNRRFLDMFDFKKGNL